MKRNLNNYIKFEQIEENLEVSPKRSQKNREEIKTLFESEITGNLLSQSEQLLSDAIKITFSQSLSDVTIDLKIDQSFPYNITRNETEIKETALSSDFPYSETLDESVTGEVTYTVENNSGNSDSVTLFHEPVKISSSTVGKQTTIDLETAGGTDYEIKRGGTSLKTGKENIFPFTTSPSSVSSPITYEVENSLGYSDSSEVAPVEISLVASGPDVEISLETDLASSYAVKKGGETIAEGIGGSGFPFTETLGNAVSGQVEYEVESDLGFVDRAVAYPIKISCSASSSNVTIDLFIDGNGPYKIRRGGTVIKEDVSDGDFPFTDDSSSLSGNVTYEVENYNGNVDSCTVTI